MKAGDRPHVSSRYRNALARCDPSSDLRLTAFVHGRADPVLHRVVLYTDEDQGQVIPIDASGFAELLVLMRYASPSLTDALIEQLHRYRLAWSESLLDERLRA